MEQHETGASGGDVVRAPQEEQFRNPPVRRVMLFVHFESVADLQTLDLAPLRTRWADTFPQLQEMAPLPSWNSDAGDVTFVDEGGPWPMPACLFYSFEGDREVLVQRDRIVLTWRFKSEKSSYPGFYVLLAQMINCFADLNDAIEASGNERPRVGNVSLQYTNELEGVDHQDAAEAVIGGRQIEQSASDRDLDAVRLTKHYCATDANRNVTLNVTIAEWQDSVGEEHGHGRGSTLLRVDGDSDVSEDEDYVDRLSSTHETAIELFDSLIGSGLKKQWRA